MTKLVFNTRNFPFPDRDEFLIPFDKVFDKMLETNFPEVIDQVGVTPYSTQHTQKSTSMSTMTRLVLLLRFLVYQRNKSKWM